MEGAQRCVFGSAAIWIVGRGIVAEADQFDTLHAKNAPGLRPTAIIADHHAHDGMVPVRASPKRGKSQIAIVEITFFKLLVTRAGTRLERARQMHLAITAENFALAIDQDRSV